MSIDISDFVLKSCFSVEYGEENWVNAAFYLIKIALIKSSNTNYQ